MLTYSFLKDFVALVALIHVYKRQEGVGQGEWEDTQRMVADRDLNLQPLLEDCSFSTWATYCNQCTIHYFIICTEVEAFVGLLLRLAGSPNSHSSCFTSVTASVTASQASTDVQQSGTKRNAVLPLHTAQWGGGRKK